jgi:hypothetical protein
VKVYVPFICSVYAGDHDCGLLHESDTRYMSLATLSNVLSKQYGKDDVCIHSMIVNSVLLFFLPVARWCVIVCGVT